MVEHKGRHDAEGTDVGEGIELDTEGRVAADEAGDAAVHVVESRAEDDQPGGGHVPALGDVAERQEPAQQITDGEQVWDDGAIYVDHNRLALLQFQPGPTGRSTTWNFNVCRLPRRTTSNSHS